MDIKLPNGQVIEGVPEGTSKQEVMEKAIRGGYATAEDFNEAPNRNPPPMLVDAESEDFDFDAGKMISNVPDDIVNTASDMIQPFLHPIDTGKAMYGLASGLLKKAMPGDADQTDVDVASANAVGDYLYNKYGSVDKAQKAFQERPIDVLSDVSGVITGGSLLVGKAASKIGKLANMANKSKYSAIANKATNAANKVAGVAEGVAKAGTAIDPVNIAKSALAGTTKALTSKLDPIGMMESVGKFSTTLDKKLGKGARRRLAETMLKERLRFNQGGVDKLDDLVDGINAEINTMMKSDDALKQVIDPAPVVGKHIGNLKKKYGGKTAAEAAQDSKIIDDTFARWQLAQEGIENPKWSLKELQEYKQNIYQKSKYRADSTPALEMENETRKAMGKGAKEEIVARMPETAGLNQRLGSLYDLEAPMTQSAGRIANRNTMGIGAPIKMAGGHAIADVPGAVVGGIAGIWDNPAVKQSSAQRIFDLQNKSILNSTVLNPTRVGLLGDSSGHVANLLRSGLVNLGGGTQGLLGTQKQEDETNAFLDWFSQ